MAKANPVNLRPQAPEVSPDAPVIHLMDADAAKVEFTINPKAEKYVVYGNGIVMEYLK